MSFGLFLNTFLQGIYLGITLLDLRVHVYSIGYAVEEFSGIVIQLTSPPPQCMRVPTSPTPLPVVDIVSVCNVSHSGRNVQCILLFSFEFYWLLVSFSTFSCISSHFVKPVQTFIPFKVAGLYFVLLIWMIFFNILGEVYTQLGAQTHGLRSRVICSVDWASQVSLKQFSIYSGYKSFGLPFQLLNGIFSE